MWRLSNGWIVGSVWIFDRMEQAVEPFRERRFIQFFMWQKLMGRDPQSPFCVNCWWLTEEGWDLYFSSYDQYPRPDLYWGSADSDEDFLLGLVKRCNKWSRPCLKPGPTLLFWDYLPPWPSLCLKEQAVDGLAGSWYRWASGWLKRRTKRNYTCCA